MSPALIKQAGDADHKLMVDIEPDRLKHFFYLMHGEPGSRTRVLNGAILVTKVDLERLIDSLVDQMRLAHVRDYTIRVGVGFEKEIVEKSFEDFRAYSWGEPKRTRELIVKINFMYEDYESGNPLKHSMFIRIARELNTGNFFQLLASSDKEKLDDFERLMSPVFCRTDHINDDLSKALLNTVEDWHKGQKQPRLLSKTHEFAKSHKDRVARVVHYTYPLVSAFVMCLGAFKVAELFNGSGSLMPALISLLIVAVFLNSFFLSYGHRRASKIFNQLKNMSEEDVIFDITQGDDKDYSERITKNTEVFRSALFVFLWAMAQNVTAGIVAALVLEYVK